MFEKYIQCFPKKANETSKSISIVWFLHSDLRNNCKSQYDYVFRITCVMVIPVLSVKCLRQVTFWQQKKTDSKKYKHRNLLSINLACCWTISPSQIDWDPNLLWGHICGLSANLSRARSGKKEVPVWTLPLPPFPPCSSPFPVPSLPFPSHPSPSH